MQLNPSSYECPTHQTDLTDLVVETLEETRPVAYGRRGLLARRSAEQQFSVVVTCPGADKDSSHQLTCSGTYR